MSHWGKRHEDSFEDVRCNHGSCRAWSRRVASLCPGRHDAGRTGQHQCKSISSDISNVDIRYQSFNPSLGYAASIPIVYNGVTVKPGDVISPIPVSQKQASYSTYSASVGVSKDQWSVELYGENLSDARPQLYVSGNDGTNRITTSRPRTIGLRVTTKI